MAKGYHSRKKRVREPKRKVIIVCEGKKAEKDYFAGLRTRKSGLKIMPVYGKCTDPKSIVKFAKKRMNTKWSLDLNEGDSVWCAFDADENSTQELKEAHEYAKSNNIEIALSNPCFEIWLLLHYKQVFSHMSRQEVVKELKTLIKGYEKNKEINSLLIDKLPTAIKNAKKLNALHKKNEVSIIGRESNPSTQVYKLVELIHQLTEK